MLTDWLGKKDSNLPWRIQSQLSNPPNTPIISPHPADINHRLCHEFRHSTICLLDCDLRHITKGLTGLGILGDVLSCCMTDNAYRHGAPPEDSGGKLFSVRAERAREMPWEGGSSEDGRGKRDALGRW